MTHVLAQERIPTPPVAAQLASTPTMLALDLGTTTGWALRAHDGLITSGTVSFRPSRYDGGGMRYLRFRGWLDRLASDAGVFAAIYFEEVRRHIGTDAAHLYGGFLATLTAWCEEHEVPYEGVPVGTIKRFATGKGILLFISAGHFFGELRIIHGRIIATGQGDGLAADGKGDLPRLDAAGLEAIQPFMRCPNV